MMNVRGEMCCENCEKFHLFDEEAIMIDGSLDGFGDCFYHGEIFHKKSLCKHWNMKYEED